MLFPIKNKRITLFCYLTFPFIFLFIFPFSAIAQREIKTINDGWYFIRQDIPNASEIQTNINEWELVSIPHSWNTDSYITKDYYKGTSWYRKNLFIPETDKEKKIFIKFEAANQVCTVYINGKLAGEHKGGYTAFTFDITSLCKFGQDNLISIKVDNSTRDIPPISADFTFFGGIYRDIWLITTPKQHLDMLNYGSGGLFIDTKDVSASSASYTVRGTLINESTEKSKIKITHTVRNPQNEIINILEETVTLNSGEKKNFRQSALVKNPKLWSPETPALYTVETRINNSKTGQLLDKTTTYTGFRWYSFDAQKGFSLNGKPYKLNGVCRHQDQKPVANALSDEMHRRDIKLIKDMGANFIRISHYPQDDAILEQCNKLGLLVWEEIPIIDIVPSDDEYTENCENMLRDMIRQHYNHPSIIMWGYMNEILLVTSRKYKGDEYETIKNRSLKLAQHLENVLREEDSSRPSVMAFHGSTIYNRDGFNKIVDVIGWNLYQGWYSNGLGDFDNFVDKQQSEQPDKPIIISEYGAGSDKRIHSLSPTRFDFSMEYQQKYIEHYLKTIENKDFISGGTYWNFIDFGSAQRDESMPRINNKGIVYSNRQPKDVYYLFQSFFRKDIPVLHIASHDWQNRTGISANNDPVVQPVKIYTNLDNAELFMNGKSLGTKSAKNHTIEWDVPFNDGSHFFVVKSNYEGKTLESGLTITFNTIPGKLTADNFENKELAINIGSKSFFTSDVSNLTWIPDRPYEAGGFGYIGGETYTTQSEITETFDNPLYQTLLVSPEIYRLDVPEGEYEIELSFADIFKPKTRIAHNLDTSKEENSAQNVFDIVINDITVEQNVNIGESVGNYSVVKKRFIIDVKKNQNIQIKLPPVKGKAYLNALKVRKI